LIVNRTAATFPGSMMPLADLRSVGVTHLSHVVVISSSMMPAARAIIGTVAPQANTSISGFSSNGRYPGGLPIPISNS
jgi:hypothetical protein